MNDSTALIWLTSIEGLGSKNRALLLSRFPEPSCLWEDPLAALPYLGSRALALLREARSEEYLDGVLCALEEKEVRALTWLDDGYPARLRSIPDAPPVLFAQGSLPPLERAVAVVGTRKCSSDGRMTAERMSCELAEGGVTVISGLADGIDTFAHRGCLQGGAPTVAVMGCAIDGCYPAENRALKEQIIAEGGCILSEHAPGARIRAYHFARRNRIISGLSQAVVVVEAGEKSGALITAQFAQEQGRMLFAVPGSIYSQACRGSNRLLTSAAHAALSAGDIFSAFAWRQGAPAEAREEPLLLDDQSRRIVEFLKNDEKSFDEIVNELKIEPWELNSLLTILEMQGIIRQSAGKLYRSIL